MPSIVAAVRSAVLNGSETRSLITQALPGDLPAAPLMKWTNIWLFARSQNLNDVTVRVIDEDAIEVEREIATELDSLGGLREARGGRRRVGDALRVGVPGREGEGGAGGLAAGRAGAGVVILV